MHKMVIKNKQKQMCDFECDTGNSQGRACDIDTPTTSHRIAIVANDALFQFRT